MKNKRNKNMHSGHSELMLKGFWGLIALVFCLPIVYVIMKSFQWEKEIGLGQFVTLFEDYPSYFTAMKNSAFYAVIATFVGVILALPISYLFAKVSFRYRDAFFFLYVLVMMLPAQSTILGQYLMMNQIGWLDTKMAVLIPLILSPIAVYLLRQNFKLISAEIIDAARLESNSFPVVMRYVILPQMKGILGVTIALIFCESWNVIEPAIILLPKSEEHKPLSVVMGRFPEEIRFACATMYLLPVFLVVIVIGIALLKRNKES